MKVIQILPNLALGGAEIMVETLSSALRDLGIEVTVVSLYSEVTAISKRLEKAGIPVIFLNKKPGFDWMLVTRLFKIFWTEKPDVVHSHLYATTYVVPAALLARVKVIVHTIHSMADKEVGSLKRRIYKLFYKWLNVKPIAISSRVQKSFWDVYRLDDLEVPVIANGIDLGKCKRKVYIEDASSAVQVLHIGSFKKAKNHIGLIDSFRIVHEKNPNIVLNLIGAGHLEEMTRKRVEQLGLVEHVVFWGSKDDVFSYLEEADIFVLPSLWEGMPISLIEAMGTGVAIVATNVGGIPDMLENEVTALLVDVDEFEIADAILRLAENFELRERLGSNARSRSANFSAETMAMSYLKVYNESLEEKFSARRK